jgi:hypothetical protein
LVTAAAASIALALSIKTTSSVAKQKLGKERLTDTKKIMIDLNIFIAL